MRTLTEDEYLKMMIDGKRLIEEKCPEVQNDIVELVRKWRRDGMDEHLMQVFAFDLVLFGIKIALHCQMPVNELYRFLWRMVESQPNDDFMARFSRAVGSLDEAS